MRIVVVLWSDCQIGVMPNIFRTKSVLNKIIGIVLVAYSKKFVKKILLWGKSYSN